MSNWPKRPDGIPMTMGEMTPQQRKEQAELACKKLNEYFNKPEVKAALTKVLES